MNLVVFEILSLPGLTKEPVWDDIYIFARQVPNGKMLVHFMDFSKAEESSVDLYLNGEEVFCSRWVFTDIPDRERLVAELEQGLAQTALRYCLAQPGDYEYAHIEKICNLPRITRHRI